jgi:eukaryotic-like serine/threonine-protein kinase
LSGMRPTPDRDRLIDEITSLHRRLDTLHRELATVVDDDDVRPTEKHARKVDAGPAEASPPEAPPPPRALPAMSSAVTAPAVPRPGPRPPRPAASSAATIVEPRIPFTTPQPPGGRPPSAPRIDPGADAADRYTAGELLGEGGMGEVRLCLDRRIGRTVAMKLIRPEKGRRPKLRARFLFEAKVQGQLEHPAIVPVYDLGVRADGTEYFTMKRVRGRTLHDILKNLRHGDRGTALAYPRRRLLTAFQTACQAIEFAHQHGVVHRDLKPPNIMLGTLGELHILDWGLAKLIHTDRAVSSYPETLSALAEARGNGETEVGEVLGTPGYMSPEQAAGASDVDAKTDVFALGAILFEILTLNYLIPGSSSQEISRATLKKAYSARISQRYPDLDVPPELEEACVRATVYDRAQRTPSAMALHEAVERYLEGDRDATGRRSLAARHTRAAIAALAETAEATTPDVARKARARAVREVSRALAIDPGHPTALRTMVKLMTQAPAEPAPEAEAEVRRIEAVARPKVARRGTFAYLAAALNLLFAGWLGIRDGWLLGGATALLATAALVAFVASKRPRVAASPLTPALLILLSSCAIALSSALFGPFVYVPSLCAANVVVFVAGVDRRLRLFAIACGTLAIAAPVLGQELGLLPPSWVFHDGAISILPRAVDLPPVRTTIVLALEALGAVLFPALLVGAERDARAKAERKLAVQAHQFAEFLPPEAKPAAGG